MPDGIALLRVQHQLRLGCRSGGEVEQEGIFGLRLDRRVCAVFFERKLVGDPALDGIANQDLLQLCVRRNTRHRTFVGHYHARLAALEAVLDLGFGGKGGSRHNYRADFDRRQDEFPNRGDVRQTKHDAIARLYALPLQEVRHAVGTLSHFFEAEL